MKGLNPINYRFLFAALLSTAALVQPGFGQVLFSSGTYVQPFNTLGSSGSSWTDNSTLLGWYADQFATPGQITAYLASGGTATTGGLYSFGAGSSSERALGALTSGGTGDIAFGVRFLNDKSQTITGITVGYTGEQWRANNNTSQTLAFSYLVGSNLTDPDVAHANTWNSVPALSFTSPVNSTAGALDGNSAPNRQVFTSVPLTGVQVLPGQEIFLRWFATKVSPGSGDGLAIDDLTISFSGASSTTNPPSITDEAQPQNRTNNAGTTATFTVTSDGTPPFTYRWWKGGTRLSDGGNVSGATNAILTISNVLKADEGSFLVGVTNSAGGTRSAAAVLVVNDPAILSQPGSHTFFTADPGVLSLAAGGTPTLAYRWYKDDAPLSNGGAISGATSNTLVISPLQVTDAGTYRVIVSNPLGTATSANAVVTIRQVPSARVALWDFNDANAPVASPTPCIGNGAASLLNGLTGTFVTGSPRDSAVPNQGWNTSKYPTATDSNKTAGVQFKLSTLGYTNIMVTWEQQNSATASKYARLQYSTDGTHFSDLDLVSGATSFAYCTHNFTGVQEVENNPNFAFRIVSEFESTAAGGADNYVATGSGSTYGSAGTMRFDLVAVFGEPNGPVPIPLRIQLLGNKAVLTWSDSSLALQSAPKLVSNLFTNIQGATSPYTNAIGTAPQFFRLKH